MHIFRSLSLGLILLIIPIALLSSSNPARTLQEIRREFGIPAQMNQATNSATQAAAPFSSVSQEEQEEKKQERDIDQQSTTHADQSQSYAIGEIQTVPSEKQKDREDHKEAIVASHQTSVPNEFRTMDPRLKSNDVQDGLIVAAATNNIRLLKLYLKQIDMLAPIILCGPEFDIDRRPVSFFLDMHVQINARKLALHLFKGSIIRPSRVSLNEGSVSLTRAIEAGRLEIFTLLPGNALSLAAILGHIEAVEIFLDTNNWFECSESLASISEAALVYLLLWSDLVTEPAYEKIAEELLFQAKINHGNYPAIARRLLQELTRRVNSNFLPRRKSVYRKITGLLHMAMVHGSTDMLKLIAETFRNVPDAHTNFAPHANRIPLIPDDMAEDTVCGEKLGLLLSLNLDPISFAYQMTHKMTADAPRNPRLLSRLKKFIRRRHTQREATRALMDPYLPPVLTEIVADYSLPQVTKEAKKQIMAMRPAVQWNLDIDDDFGPAIELIEQEAQTEAEQRAASEQRMAMQERKSREK